jgi:hypothetical protein
VKIRKHPRLRDIQIGDEVYSYRYQLFARVEEIFPSAVCVKVGILSPSSPLELVISPQLWRAADIENLSICRYCGSRDDLQIERPGTGIPCRICIHCRTSPATIKQPRYGWYSREEVMGR